MVYQNRQKNQSNKDQKKSIENNRTIVKPRKGTYIKKKRKDNVV